MFSITLKTLFATKKISPLKTQKYEMSIFSWELSKYSVICNDCPKSSDLYRHKNVTSDGINQIFYALCCIRFDYVSFNLNKNENTIIKNTKIRSHNVKFMWNLLAWCWKSNEGMIQYKAYQQKIKIAIICPKLQNDIKFLFCWGSSLHNKMLHIIEHKKCDWDHHKWHFNVLIGQYFWDSHYWSRCLLIRG